VLPTLLSNSSYPKVQAQMQLLFIVHPLYLVLKMSATIVGHARISNCLMAAVLLRNATCNLIKYLIGKLIARLVKASKSSKPVSCCH
jgi:hypothetical protein